MTDEKHEYKMRLPRVNNWVRTRIEDSRRKQPTYPIVEHDVALWIEEIEGAWSDLYARFSELQRKERERYNPGAMLTEFNRILGHVQNLDEFTEHISAQDIIDRLHDRLIKDGL